MWPDQPPPPLLGVFFKIYGEPCLPPPWGEKLSRANIEEGAKMAGL